MNMERLHAKCFINDFLKYFVNEDDDVIDEIRVIAQIIAVEYIIDKRKMSKNTMKSFSKQIYTILPKDYTQTEIIDCIQGNLCNYSSENCNPPHKEHWNSKPE